MAYWERAFSGWFAVAMVLAVPLELLSLGSGGVFSWPSRWFVRFGTAPSYEYFMQKGFVYFPEASFPAAASMKDFEMGCEVALGLVHRQVLVAGTGAVRVLRLGPQSFAVVRPAAGKELTRAMTTLAPY